MTINIKQPRAKKVEIPVRIVPISAKLQYERARKTAYNEIRQALRVIAQARRSLKRARLEYKLSKVQ